MSRLVLKRALLFLLGLAIVVMLGVDYLLQRPTTSEQSGGGLERWQAETEALKRELYEDRDLWYGEREDEEANWIWEPTEEDLEWVKGVEGGAIVLRGVIVDEKTEEPMEAQVLINGQPVATAQEARVLMWQAAERPVEVRVEAPGYEPWAILFRFNHKGLQVIMGRIRLKPLKGRVADKANVTRP